ncbi:unnamed protein product [Prunus armeniaca]
MVLYHYELPNSASVDKLMSDEDVLKMCECVPGTKRNVKQPTNAKGKTVKIVKQEPVEDFGDFSKPEAPKNAKGKIVAKAAKKGNGKTMVEVAKKGKGKTVAEAPKKGKVARSLKDKEMAEPEPPKSVRAARSSKGKEVAEPEAPKRARATRSSKDASSFADSEYGGDNIEEITEETIFLQQWIADHAPVEDTFQPLEDEEINEGECGVVNESGVVNKGKGGVVNEGEGPSGDQPLHASPSGDHPSQAGPSGDHPSQTGQNEDQPLQTGQNREQPSRTTDFHHIDLEDTRMEEGDQAVEDELRSVHSDEDDETVARGKNSNTITMKQTNKTLDCKVFREAVREYCLLSGKEVTFTRNEKYKLKAVCKAVSCPWQIYVAWKNPTDRSLVVKYYNLNHDCVKVFENTQASTTSEFKVGISRMKAYRAKAEALRMIEGSVAE